MTGSLRVVVVVPHVPWPGVDHAGGQYLLAHVAALGDAEVTVVAPDTGVNRAAARFCPVPVVLLDTLRWQGSARPVASALRAWRPWLPGPGAARGLSAPSVASLLAQADVVELHWPEHLGLVPVVRRLTAARVVIAPQDVLSHRLASVACAPGPLVRRAHAALVLGRVRRAERRLYPQADAVVVLSAPDAGRVRSAGGTPVVVAPPTSVPGPGAGDPAAHRVAQRVVFVAALARQVNDDAARWLVSEIWPAVLRARPGSELYVVGAGPSARLRRAADAAAGVTVTGAVPEVGSWYDSADVVVAPLRSGAGVKLKCVDAVLRGLPLVGTPVAAEGLPGHWFAAVSASADQLAAAVVAAMAPDADEVSRRSTVAAEAATVHSAAAHRAALAQLYAVLVPGGPAVSRPRPHEEAVP